MRAEEGMDEHGRIWEVLRGSRGVRDGLGGSGRARVGLGRSGWVCKNLKSLEWSGKV